MSHKCGRFCVMSFGVALGIVWGLSMLLLGLATWFFDWGAAFTDLMASMYYGFDGTLLGSLIGGLWGFIDAFIAGVIFAWLYNLMSSWCCKKGKCSCCDK